VINRKILGPLKDSRKSILLLGPRQAGKSTLVQSLKPDLTIQLADEMEFFTFSSNPSELRIRVDSENPKMVFIDEVQRLPALLNTVQSLIDEKRGLKFFLTGSSARKLKRGGANLLPGRVLNFFLGPLVASELSYKADTRRILTYGALPEVYLERDESLIQHLLKSYVSGYVQEEIKAEALVRNLGAFTRFIQTSVQSAGHFVDYSKLARQAKISRHAVGRFFEIFEDTLIGHRVWPFEALLEKADLIKHPKFYLFDNGVFNALLGNFNASADRLGVLAEQLVYTQILHSSWAARKDVKISSFRTRGGLEVDFIVELDGDTFAIEVKGGEDVQTDDTAGVLQFKKYFPKCRDTFVFHMSGRSRKLGSVWAHPWQEGLRSLGI
jgi:uncharacterized protein